MLLATPLVAVLLSATQVGPPPTEAVSIAMREGLLGETFYGLYPLPMREVAKTRLGLVQVLAQAASRHQQRAEAFLGGPENERERAALLRLGSLLPAYEWAEAEFHRQFGDAGKIVVILTDPIRSATRQIAATSEPRHRLFRDVPVNHWAAKAVGDLRALGLLDGYPDGTFSPSP